MFSLLDICILHFYVWKWCMWNRYHVWSIFLLFYIQYSAFSCITPYMMAWYKLCKIYPAVCCHTRCSLSDQTTMSSSHHTAKNIFHVEKYLMQTTGPGQTLDRVVLGRGVTMRPGWRLLHRGGRWGCRAPHPASDQRSPGAEDTRRRGRTPVTRHAVTPHRHDRDGRSL